MKAEVKLILAFFLLLAVIEIYSIPKDPMNVWKPYFGKYDKKTEKAETNKAKVSVKKADMTDDDSEVESEESDEELESSEESGDDSEVEDSAEDAEDGDNDDSSEDDEDSSEKDENSSDEDNEDEKKDTDDENDDGDSSEEKEKNKNKKGDDEEDKNKKTESKKKVKTTSKTSKKDKERPKPSKYSKPTKKSSKGDKAVKKLPVNPNQGPKGEKGDRGPKGEPGDGSMPSIPMQAALSTVLTDHFGPVKDTILPFDLILLDLGDNYDNETGIFICTIPGTYVVSLYLMSHPGAKVNARIYINSRPIAALWADDNKNVGFYPSSSIQTVTRLEFGDQVYVMLVDGGYGESWVHANYNAFTIYLLYEDAFMKKRR